MTFAAYETSVYSGSPFELYLFQTESEEWSLTSGDTERALGERVYTPEAIKRGEIAQTPESQSGEVTITIPRTHDIASRFLSYIPTSPMSLVIYRGHDGDPDSETVTNFTGTIAKAEFSDVCTLTAAPESNILRRKIPSQKFQAPCNWILFSPGCGMDREDYKLTGTISSVSSDGATLTSDVFATRASGWLQCGYVEIGNDRRLILSHTGNTVVLIAGIAGLTAGKSVNAYAGCRGTTADCYKKFSNLANFWGFDRIPTRNPFDGGLV